LHIFNAEKLVGSHVESCSAESHFTQQLDVEGFSK